MKNMNFVQLLSRIIDMMTEIKKEANIFRYDNLFIPFLHVQLLIIVVYIYLLTLSDMDTVEVILHILRSLSTKYMFMLAKLNSILY